MCYQWYMSDQRVEVLLDEAKYEVIAREAERQGRSIPGLIEAAIDRFLDEGEQRRRAIDYILAAEPVEVPDDPRDLRRELDEAHDRIAR